MSISAFNFQFNVTYNHYFNPRDTQISQRETVSHKKTRDVSTTILNRPLFPGEVHMAKAFSEQYR